MKFVSIDGRYDVSLLVFSNGTHHLTSVIDRRQSERGLNFVVLKYGDSRKSPISDKLFVAR